MLVSELITQAFLDLGGIATGETITGAEQADAFLRLNQMIKSWSTEELTVPTKTHTGFAMVTGTVAYTLGTAGTLVTAGRVLRVTGASSVSGNFRQACDLLSFEQFAAQVSDPLGSQSVLAKVVAADGSFPSINLKVFPVPAAGPGTLWLDYWMAIAAFAAVGDTITLPEGWEHALHFNLAVSLYPQYARASGIPPELAANAQQSKGSLVALNQSILGQGQAAGK